MIRRIAAIYHVEVGKAIHLKFTYVGPLLILLVILCLPAIEQIERDNVSDYGFIAKATPTALNLVGLLVLLVYCSGLMSSELQSGTIRMVLVRPLRRREFVAAKLLFAMTYATCLTLLAAGASWLLVFAFGEARGVSSGGEMIFTGWEMGRTYLIALTLDLAPQWAAASFALMISSLTRSTGAAVGTTVGIWVALDAVKYALHVDRFLFSSYMETPWQVFADNCDALDASWFPDVYWLLGTSAVSMALCTSVAVLALGRRNLSA